ncbi:MAG: DUF5615 family PIN-like protein [Nitrospirota bacterium]
MPEIKIVADENVHVAILEGLQRKGIIECAVQAGESCGQQDEEQLEYATAQGACLLTHDDDLLVIADRWKAEGRKHGGLLYVHQRSRGMGEIIRQIKYLVDTKTAEDMENHIEFL